MNQLTIAGHLGGDAEVRFSKAGTAITTFSVPAESGWGDNKTVTWVKCVLFGKAGEQKPHGMTDYLTKGKFVVVSGEMEGQEWEGNKGKMFTIQMVVKDITPGPAANGGGKPKSTGYELDEYPENDRGDEPAGSGAPAAEIDDDDIPF